MQTIIKQWESLDGHHQSQYQPYFSQPVDVPYCRFFGNNDIVGSQGYFHKIGHKDNDQNSRSRDHIFTKHQIGNYYETGFKDGTGDLVEYPDINPLKHLAPGNDRRGDTGQTLFSQYNTCSTFRNICGVADRYSDLSLL